MLPRLVFRMIRSFSPFVGLSVLCFLLAASSSASTPIQPVFLTTPTYAGSGSVIIADVNGDGIPDLISGENRVGLLLGNGDGSFQTAKYYSAGGSVFDLAVADLNHDGKPDIIVGVTIPPCTEDGCSGAAINVLFGNGDGTFQQPVTIPGAPADNFVVGDVNGDGIPDLVFYDVVLLGNGDGTFRSVPSAYSLGGMLGDVNGDGKLDIVGLSYNENTGQFDVTVSLGNGDGTFQAPIFNPLPPGDISFNQTLIFGNPMALGDLNGDGKLDVVLGMQDYTSNCQSGCVSVLLGNGDGTFQPQVEYPSGYSLPESVAIGEVTGDGKLDIIVGSFSGFVAVLPGNGNGTFQPPFLYNSGGNNGVEAIAIADLNGDGIADVSAANVYGTNGNGLAVLLASGTGSLRAAPVLIPPSSPNFFGSLTVANLTNNGPADLIANITCDEPPYCAPNPLAVLLGNGNGTFQPAQAGFSAGAGTVPYYVAAADVNGDGKGDLLVTNRFACPSCYTGSVNVFLGNGDGTFQTPVSYPAGGYGTEQVTTADVNGDGKPDLVVVSQLLCYIFANCPHGTVGVLLGNGDGSFQPVVSYDTGAQDAGSVAVADLNGDGKPDIVVADNEIVFSNPGMVGVLLNKGDGTFYPAVTYASGGALPYSVAVADVNGDGIPDLVVAHYCVGVNDCNSNTVSVLLGNGDGTFMAPVSIPIPQLSWAQVIGNADASGPSGLVLADFNHSGILDIVVGGEYLFLGNGEGTFQPPIILGPSGPSVAVGDFNDDDRPDLVVGGGGTILLNITPTYTTTTTLSSSSNSAVAGQPVTFSATVTPSGNAGAFTGRVTFFDGSAGLGSVFLKNGQATFTTSRLSPGMHSITAVYGADTNYQFQTSTSAAVNETIAQPSVTISGSPQQPLTTDGSGNFVAQVTITNTGNVTVNSVQVSSATLGSGSLLSAPAPVTNLAPGASAVVTLTFPSNSVPSGAASAALKVSGTYSVTSPAISGNWALSFRRVTL